MLDNLQEFVHSEHMGPDGSGHVISHKVAYTPDRKKASNEIEISNYRLVIVPVSSK